VQYAAAAYFEVLVSHRVAICMAKALGCLAPNKFEQQPLGAKAAGGRAALQSTCVLRARFRGRTSIGPAVWISGAIHLIELA
jgi:hypothetical protein